MKDTFWHKYKTEIHDIVSCGAIPGSYYFDSIDDNSILKRVAASDEVILYISKYFQLSQKFECIVKYTRFLFWWIRGDVIGVKPIK